MSNQAHLSPFPIPSPDPAPRVRINDIALARFKRKKPQHIHAVLDLVDPGNWGYEGVFTTEYRERAS